MELFTTPEGKIIIWLILVSSIALHEWGHAFSADKLGDFLPRQQGRVTLNPIAHIDLIGTVIIPLFMLFASPGFAIIGWGKPVQISLPNRKTRKRDDMIITACGPIMNLVIALVCSILAGVLFRFGLEKYALICVMAVMINAALFVFNLIPIPPLDGSHFLRYAVNMSEEFYMRLSQWGFVILLVLINLGPTRALLSSAIQIAQMPFNVIIHLVAGG